MSPRGGWRGKKYDTEADRFWAKVDKSGGPDVCWPWTAAKDRYGYGNFHIWKNGKGYMEKAHRVAFRLTHGYVPPSIMHKCDNPPCCNPACLLPGTIAANIADRDAKGRTAHGEQKAHKVIEASIPEIRRRAAAGESQTSLARAYGVSQMSISKIVRRQTWKHVK